MKKNNKAQSAHTIKHCCAIASKLLDGNIKIRPHLQIYIFTFLCKSMNSNLLSQASKYASKKKKLSLSRTHTPTPTRDTLKDLAPSGWQWNIASGSRQNLKFRHILRGKIWQPSARSLFPEKQTALCRCHLQARSYLVAAGRMWSVLGGFVDGLTGAAVGVVVVRWPLFLWAWGAENLQGGWSRKPVPVRGIIRGSGPLECLKVSLFFFGESARTQWDQGQARCWW